MLILAVVMLWTVQIGAVPGPPQTLRMLTRSSELIVVAEVEQITRYEVEDHFDTAIAHLAVQTTVKGSADSTVIKVYYPANLLCPEPPRYRKGATVLAFLSRRDRGGYHTTALSYGAKNLTRRELEVYTARIADLVEIERETIPLLRRPRLVEWLVLCAEEPATRWEGAYDLFNSHELKKFEHEHPRQSAINERQAELLEPGRQQRLIDFTTLLSPEQKQRLAAALYRSPALTRGTDELLDLVDLWGDDGMPLFLWSYLQAGKKDHPYQTHRLMTKLAKALNNQAALKLAEQFGKIVCIEQGLEHRALREQFIALIEQAGAPPLVEINNDAPPAPERPPALIERPNESEAPTLLSALTSLLVAALDLRFF